MSKARDKVLLISPQPFFEWRGSPIRVAYTAQALAELGFDVDLLVQPVGVDKAIPGVRLLRAPNWFGIKRLPIGPSFWKAVSDVLLLLEAWRLARRNRYRVVHGVEEAGAIAVRVGRRRGARVVFEKHSDPASYRRGPLRNLILWLYAKVEAYSIRNADAVIATGPGLAEQARAVDPDKAVHHIFDIPSSLAQADPARVRELRAELQSAEGDRLVLYVGSFAVYQGIDLMFEAIPAVVREYPEAHFVIIGGSAAEIEDRRHWLASRGAGDAVEFLGRVHPDELPDYLAAADVLLSPRIAGTNTPLKILDYLKAGGAIVATGSEANRLILDDSTALLAEPDAAAFAAAIGRAVGDYELRQRLGRAGRALVEERYNFGQFERLLEKCYRGVLETE